jgi:protein-disulfide isomerase
MAKLRCLVLFVLAALLLGACSSGAAPTETHTPTQEPATATDRPAISTPTRAATLAPATATEPPRATATQSAQPATDTPAPATLPAFLEVRPDDWVRGPADAAVTIVEYSDFQ